MPDPFTKLNDAQNNVFGPPAAPIKSTGNKEVDQELQKITETFEAPAGKNESLQGKVVYGIKLKAATATRIDHELGTKPRTWTAGGFKNTFAHICQLHEADERTIWLMSTGDITFDLHIW